MKLLDRLFTWFETRIDPIRSDQYDIEPGGTFHLLWQFVSQAKLAIAVMLLVGLASGLLRASLFYMVGKLVDLLAHHDPELFLNQHRVALVAIAALLLLGRPALAATETLLGQQVILNSFCTLVRWQSHTKVMRQGLEFFYREYSGRVTTKVLQSGNVASDLVATSLQVVWSYIVFAGSTVTLLGLLDLRLAAIVLIWFLLFAITAYKFVPEIRRRARSAADSQNTLTGDLSDAYANIQTMLLFSPKPSEDALMVSSFQKCLSTFHHFFRATGSVKGVLSVLSSTSIVVSAITAIQLWRAHIISIGDLALIFGLILQLDSQLDALMGLLTGLFRSLGSFQSCMDVVMRPPTVSDRIDSATFTFRAGHIRFEKVTFGYTKPTRIIDCVSFNIEPGQKVGIVGRSGSGKSTIVNLLLGFYDVDGGRILVDGQDIRDVTRASLRERISLMTQDTSLLHRSVFENIALGKATATEAEVREAAERAHALEFIESLLDSKGRAGFDAHVGERGLQLSGGQRQRIGLARVLLKNAPILVFDEATSALDSRLDANIQASLMNAMQGKTVLAIAHRLSTIAKMDRLLVVEGGRIVEDGSHDELLSIGGLYCELWRKQFDGLSTTESDLSTQHDRGIITRITA